MIPGVPLFLPMPFAQNGERHEIPGNNTTPGSPDASWNLGFPPVTGINKQAGGKPPTRLDFQGILHALSQHIFYLQSGGIYPWQGASDGFAGLNYLKGARVLGSDGKEYIARKASGPEVMGANGAIGPVDPVGDTTGTWRGADEPNYELCEFYYFRHPDLRPGFEELAGAVIEGAAEMYPEAWAYLQTVAGQKLCKTEAEWQALSTKGYYTLADGTVIGFNGIGGVPFYSLNTATGALRMPDIRGMYPEAAGFDSLNVGTVRIDAIRNIWGHLISIYSTHAIGEHPYDYSQSAMFWEPNPGWQRLQLTNVTDAAGGITLNAARMVPVGAVTAPRHFGVLACAYLGNPHAAD